MNGELLEAGGYRSPFLEPADTTLDDVAPAILLSIEGWGTTSAAGNLVAALRNDRSHVMSSQPLTNASMAVGFVPRHPLRALARNSSRPSDAHGIEYGFGIQCLVGLPSTELDRQRQPGAISDQVQLCAPSPSAAPQRVILWFLIG